VDHCAPWAAAFEHSGPRNSRKTVAGFRVSGGSDGQEAGLAGVTVQMPDGSAGGVAWHSANPAIKPAAVMSDLRRKLGIA